MAFTLNPISKFLWELPKEGDMLVPGRIYGDKEIIAMLLEDDRAGKEWNSLRQIYNVACLPGIQKYSLAMSDVHPGYGFVIGGVGAFDVQTGVISVAGVGFDINCGVRALRTTMTRRDFNEARKDHLGDELYRTVPAGVGSEGHLRLDLNTIDAAALGGAEFALAQGYGLPEDLEYIEERGKIANARPENVSDKAKKRQLKQLGTLGSGNHYLEVQYVEEIFDAAAAKAFGLHQDQVIIFVHCGSRAYGHQIGSDYLQTLEAAAKKYAIPIRERELVCAPFNSPEGQKYYTAVNCGINMAFANRQAITHLTRLAFERAVGLKPEEITTLYEIAHNTVKVERHNVDGQEKELVVHRKGSTRAFGPNRPEVPAAYRAVGQPVLIGGTMGTHSYILHGTDKTMSDTF